MNVNVPCAFFRENELYEYLEAFNGWSITPQCCIQPTPSRAPRPSLFRHQTLCHTGRQVGITYLSLFFPFSLINVHSHAPALLCGAYLGTTQHCRITILWASARLYRVHNLVQAHNFVLDNIVKSCSINQIILFSNSKKAYQRLKSSCKQIYPQSLGFMGWKTGTFFLRDWIAPCRHVCNNACMWACCNFTMHVCCLVSYNMHCIAYTLYNFTWLIAQQKYPSIA